MGPDSVSIDGSEPSNNNNFDQSISLDPRGKDDDDDVFTRNGDVIITTCDVRRREYECGLWSWRPSCLQPCASLPSFTIIMSCLGMCGSINFSHFTAVITQIERQYGMSSSVAGFVKNIDNVGFLISVLLFSHFCRHSNKPRLFAITNVVASIAICFNALPHFIFRPTSSPDLQYSTNTSLNHSSIVSYRYPYCDGPDEPTPAPESCGKRSLNVGALVILILSGLLQGAARSPQYTLSLTYMDDTSRDASPKYFGFIFGSRSLAPLLGFLLGAWTTTIYVDLSDPGIPQSHPRWLGAWWLGFLISGALTIVWTLPLLLYPAKIPSKTQKWRQKKSHVDGEDVQLREMTSFSGKSPGISNGEVVKVEQQGEGHNHGNETPGDDITGDFVDNLKDMPRALCRLLKNPMFLFIVLGACCNMSLLGFITFLSKHIELQFRTKPSTANIYTGCISAFAFSVGPVVGGRLMARFKLTARQGLRLILVIEAVSVACFVGMTLIGCPQADWAGEPFQHNSSVLSTLACSQGCGCDDADFSPVCAGELNYYSPCHAGCAAPSADNLTEHVHTFTDCACSNVSGTASLGRCDPPCVMMIPYLILLGLGSFITSMFIVPLMIVLLRCVEERDKSLSIALGTAFVNFAAFPAPIIFGFAVDSTCLVKQRTCGREGACLYHNPTDLRYWLHGLEVLFKTIALIFFILALLKSRSVRFTGEDDDGEVRDEAEVTQQEKRLTSTSSMSVS